MLFFYIDRTTNSGHYTSYSIKVNNICYQCNDNVVTVVELTDICDSKDGYILI